MRRMHRTLGIARGLIVQPTTYGTDHTALIDLLAAEPTTSGPRSSMTQPQTRTAPPA